MPGFKYWDGTQWVTLGMQGPPAYWTGPDAPPNTSMLWVDTDDPGISAAMAAEYVYMDGGWSAQQSLGANTWTLMQKIASAGTALPAGAFTENADGSVTIRDTGYYHVEAIVAFSTVAGRVDLSIGSQGSATENFHAEDFESGDRAPVLSCSGIGYFTAGTNVYVTARMAVAGNATRRRFCIFRLGAGPSAYYVGATPPGNTNTLWIDTSENDVPPPQKVLVLPTSPVDGQEVYYVADASSGIMWHLRYNAASSSAYKWECIGGPPLFAAADGGGANSTTSGTAYATTAFATPTITLPLAGDYDVDCLIGGFYGGPISDLRLWGSPDSGVGQTYPYGFQSSETNGRGLEARSHGRWTGCSAATVVRARHASASASYSFSTYPRVLWVTPVRVG